MAKAADGVWTNWAGNQRCAPARVAHPANEEELARVVKEAAAIGGTVKAVGAGHSFTDIATTSGTQVVLDRYRQVLAHDPDKRRVTVQAGITLVQLNEELAKRGLAMANMGDIAYQSISGAISTGTHGTGAEMGGIATQVVGLDLVTGDGSLLSCSATEHPDVFDAARVGLGALGLISTVTLQCVPAFHLRAIEEPMRLDHVLEHLDGYVADNDFFEFFYVPHTGWALTKRNNRTDDPLARRPRAKEWYQAYLIENVAFGALCKVGKWRPSLVPKLAKALPSSGRNEYIDDSYRVFASPRLVHFYEMEYEIPREHVRDVLLAIRQWIDRSGMHVSFPIEVRFTAADDIPLSTAGGRISAYVAVHVYRGTQHEQYFRSVEAIMDEVAGRPHWGKLHYQKASTLAPRYPRWDEFQKIRARLDPEGRFANSYTDRVLGPLASP